MNISKQAFSQPQNYRNMIMKSVRIPVDKNKYAGKTFICVSFTRFCPVGCSFCFFSSKQANRKSTILDSLNDIGIAKFIKFANSANLGYLLVSGGGEPFIEKHSLLKVVKNVLSDKIVLVTSGNWAKTETGAYRYLMKIYDAFKSRKHATKLVIRLSVDEEHAINGLGLTPAYNLLNIFEEKFIGEENFCLQFHTIFGDKYIEKFIASVNDKISNISTGILHSDAETVVKVTPAEKIITFNSGLRLKVGYAKVFNSNIKVNLNSPKIVQKNLEVFQDDLDKSEGGNPSVLANTSGSVGLDFWVNFNGNVTTWGNQVPDNIYNIYEDSYNTVVDNSFADPISLAYIEKGDSYRSKVVYEVNPKAVIRSKATNIRDYAGALVCEEELTRLYLSIRIIQDYILEGRVTEDEIIKWPLELQLLVQESENNLIREYKSSEYSIVDQYIDKNFNQDNWVNLFELINLGHYELTKEQVQKALNYYNNKMNISKSLSEVVSTETISSNYYPEERIIAIKDSVYSQYTELQENV